LRQTENPVLGAVHSANQVLAAASGWAFVQNQCLYLKYYADFENFQGGIETCLKTANTTKKKSLEILLSLKFQSFKDVHILSV
jgi:hypothetical protein